MLIYQTSQVNAEKRILLAAYFASDYISLFLLKYTYE
jgi:hypothetical protein